MENRLIFVSLVAVFLGIAIHVVSAQKFVLRTSCISESGCKDPRLPKDARCQEGFCICLNENGAPKNCSIHSTQAKFAEGRNSEFRETCKNPQDCNLPFEFCNTTRSQCACKDGYVMASTTRTCLPVARTLGSSCEEDQQCQKIMGNSSCMSEQCVCSPGYHFSGNNTCWKTLDFGERCTNDHECSNTENAVCDEQSSLCGCSNATTLSTDGQRCLVIARDMLDACIDKKQCTKKFVDSDCIDKRCQCAGNNHYERSISQCVSSKKLGEKCSGNHECYQNEENDDMNEPQSCVDHVCVCNENFVDHGDKCLFISDGASSLVTGFLSILAATLLFSRS